MRLIGAPITSRPAKSGCGTEERNSGPLLHNARSGWVGDDFDEDSALARAVEFAEEDALPGAESEFAVFDGNSLTGSGEDGLHVRVSVAFCVAIGTLIRDQAIEESFDVVGNVRIGVFVDGYTGGGVRNIDVADPAFRIGFADGPCDFASDVYKLGAAIRFDAKTLHCRRNVMGWG